MSETPEGGSGSGAGGFAPPDGGFESFDSPGSIGGFASATADAPPPPAPLPSFPQPAVPVQPVWPPAQGYAPNLYPAGYYGPPLMRNQTSGMAVAGMVIGITSLVLFWAFLLAPLLAIMGIVFSVIGLSQSSKPGWTGTGMAVAGLVCSGVTAAIWMALAIILATIWT